MLLCKAKYEPNDCDKKETLAPSKYEDSERGMRNWWKQQQKLVNAGALKPERVELFNQLLEMGDRYRHVNQWK